MTPPTDPVTFPSTTDTMGSEPSDAMPTGSLSSERGDTAASTGTARSTELLDRMVRGAHASIDRFAESAAPQLDRLERSMHGAADSLHGNADHLREVGDEWTESLRTSVREHPLAAVGIALAAGMLIARLSR